MKKMMTLALLLLCLAVDVPADAGEHYNLYEDGGFTFEYPDWKVKKPSSDFQVFRMTRGGSSILVDVYDADIDYMYDQTIGAIKKDSLIQADRANYFVEYKRSLPIKNFIKRKFVYANGKTYAVTFATLSWEVKRNEAVAAHVFASIKGLDPEPAGGGVKTGNAGPVKDEYRYGIYGIKVDGSGLERIYASHLPLRDPEVSPDGERIVFYQFTKDTNGDGRIYDGDYDSTEIAVVNVDGTGFRKLTNNRHWDIQPNWTSDGRRLVFVSNRDKPRGFDLDIFIMDLETGVVKNISNKPDLLEADVDCRAGKVVFARYDRDKSNQSICIMDEDGSGQRRISFPTKSGKSKTGNHNGDFDPNLTEDGKQVTFLRLEDDDFKIDGKVIGNYDLYIMDADGSNVKNISNTPFLEGVPAWSPDGRQISYTVTDEAVRDRYKIYVVDSDGGNKRKVTKEMPIPFLARESNWFPKTAGEHPDIVFAGEWWE